MLKYLVYNAVLLLFVGLFGLHNYGVDINGYVMDPEKGLCIWLQRRSATKQTWPGKWDNMVIPLFFKSYNIYLFNNNINKYFFLII